MLDFIKDILSAFRQSSIERIKNPFVGAFVFSWLGFNWQVLAIILFSKKDVIERVDYIKEHYDVGHFILAPALTTIVICIILPLANKVFTKFQSKPISETTDILMQSKIDIAEKQLQIADIEAKKKLAIKREEKYIEQNIYEIRDKHSRLERTAEEMTIELKKVKGALAASVNENAQIKTENSSLKEVYKIRETSLNEQIESLRKSILSLEKKEKDLHNEIKKSREKNDEYDKFISENPDILNRFFQFGLVTQPNLHASKLREVNNYNNNEESL
ncbi:hypothetical protein [Serratia surfactantfaciens]|uniref:Uncharacterized protein n=1 Tax=Serratia surfactantfaciens TaxID=2741499 RepID=A0ABS0LTF6_9GAMM|nr:hypothetical protein [Serratia surfactantfaciens]MBH1918612.1 hypothetical protein [Serratia surfactantfaciens]